VPPVADDPLRALAFAARDGDTRALERVVVAIQDDVYRLALRMLWHPEDAKDAAQEALVRIVTRIASFRGDAAFRTWAHRVAANHILNWRQSRVEQENLTFRQFADQLHDGLADPKPDAPDAALLAEEVKLGCTLGMLLCLDRDQRLAYILSDVFELPSETGAYVCGTTASAFRKRASRARTRLQAFVAEHCGLVNRDAACRCDRRVETAVRIGRVDPTTPLFATRMEAIAAVGDMERLHDLASLMRSHPDYRTPDDLVTRIRELIASGDYDVLT
jgi:RNA polymerase sigma factor (sigma-70 family)